MSGLLMGNARFMTKSGSIFVQSLKNYSSLLVRHVELVQELAIDKS